MMRVRFSRVLAGREELGDGDNARAPAFSPGLPRSSPGDWGDPGRATTLLIPQRELIPAVHTRAWQKPATKMGDERFSSAPYSSGPS
jgi:hypothetical protein